MEMPHPDTSPLRRYAEHGDEAAFAELVRQHLPLVYRCACRLLGGDAARAEDVAQEVFADLARKAHALASHPALAAWLHTTTRYAAARVRRGEQRRRTRDEEAERMNQIEQAGADTPRWDGLQPVIDEALAHLKETDREAVLLRFFAENSYAEIGRRLGLSEDAARMRTDRAMEKLRVWLARRGIGSTAAALGVAFAGQGAVAVPAGLAISVTQGALSVAAGTAVGALGATGASGGIGLSGAWFGLGAGKAAVVASLVVAAGAGGVYLATRGGDTDAGGRSVSSATGGFGAGASPAAGSEAWAALAAAWDRTGAQARTGLLLAVPADELGRRLLALWRENTVASRGRFWAIVGCWCESAPEPAAKWAVTTWDEITGEDGVKLREQAGLAWAARELTPAFAWALKLRDADSETGLAARMLGQLARTEPRAAIALAQETSDAFYQTARFGILEGWCVLDPAEAFEALGDECIAHKRTTDLLEQWANADLRAMMRWGLNGEWQSEADKDRRERLLRRGGVARSALEWSKHPQKFVPELFDAFFKDAPAGRDDAAQEARREKDAAAALAWLLGLPAEAPGTQAFIRHWGRSYSVNRQNIGTHEAQLKILRQLPDSPAKTEALKFQLREWASRDLDASLPWVLETRDQELIGQVYRGAAVGLAAEAPDQAVALYAALSDGPTKERVAVELAEAWAEKDSGAALDWLNAEQPSWVQDAMARMDYALVATWAATRPEEFVAKLADPSGDEAKRLQAVMEIDVRFKRVPRQSAKPPGRDAADLVAAYRAQVSADELKRVALDWAKGPGKEHTHLIAFTDLFTPEEKTELMRATR